MTYNLGFEKLDRSGFITPGSNILVIGPPGCGKSFFLRRLFHSNVTGSAAGILITSKEIGEDVLDWFDKKGLVMDLERFGVVDCIARTLDLGFYPKDYYVLKRVASPHDLEGALTLINEYWNRFTAKGIREIVVTMESLTKFFAHAPLIAILRFLHTLTTKVKTTGAIGLYSVDTGMHDMATMKTLENLSQGKVEMKEEGGKRYLRLTCGPTDTGWVEYLIEGNDIQIQS
jgi:KaiC/GvpD/RAD55 family RecA-like ATPase